MSAKRRSAEVQEQQQLKKMKTVNNEDLLLKAITSSLLCSEVSAAGSSTLIISDKKKINMYYDGGKFFCQLLKTTDDDGELGVTLDEDQFNDFRRLFDRLEEKLLASLHKGEKISYREPIGDMMFCSVNWRYPAVDVRAFYTDKHDELKPTRRGVAFNLREFRQVRSALEQIDIIQ